MACEWSVYRDVISVTNIYIYLKEVIVMKCNNYGKQILLANLNCYYECNSTSIQYSKMMHSSNC